MASIKEADAARDLRIHREHIWRRRRTPAPDYPDEAEKWAWREKESQLKRKVAQK
jgi:hypothetical protein